MIKFAIGFVAGTYFGARNRSAIIKWCEDTIAKLELQQDILRHDNPDIG